MNNGKNQTNTQKAIRGLSSQTIVTIVLGMVEIVSFSIMSRLLSKQDFGYYAAIVAVSTIFSSLSSNGIGSAIVQRKELTRQYIDNAFTLSLFIGIAVSGLLCMLSGVLARGVADESMQVPLMLYSTTLLFHCVTSVNMALMQRQLQFLRMGFINLLSLVITTIVAIVLALRGYGYYAILTKAILGSAISVMLSYFAAHAKYRVRFEVTIMKQIFGFSGWLMASSLFRNFANQIDRLLMSSLFSVATLGVYSRPKEFISSITDKCNSIFDTTLFPILSSIQDEEKRITKSYKVTLYFLNLVGMLLSMCFFCNSELIIRIFFGEEWLHINTLFQVVSLSSVLYVNGRVGDIYLRQGILAVAIAAMVGYMIIALSKVVYISRHIHLNIHEALICIVKGWQFMLVIVPFYAVCNYLLPHTVSYNVMQAALFVLMLIALFLIFPSFVGRYYKEYAYTRIHNITSKIMIKNRNGNTK